MISTKDALRILFLSVLSAILSISTVFLAPLPLMLVRRKDGRLAMFVASVLGMMALGGVVSWAAAAMFLGAVIYVAVFSECENQGIGYTSSVVVTVLVLAGLGLAVGSYATYKQGFLPGMYFREQISLVLSQQKIFTEMNIDKEALLRQVPSVLAIFLIFYVWINSIFISRIERALGWTPVKLKHLFAEKEFLLWRLPDFFVWIALSSAVGSFFEFEPHWLKWTLSNIFNVSVMLYFFQGLAVVVSFFTVKKVSSLWRIFGYLLIFTQLFLPVAFLGFVDLWMEFRKKVNTDKSAVA